VFIHFPLEALNSSVSSEDSKTYHSLLSMSIKDFFRLLGYPDDFSHNVSLQMTYTLLDTSIRGIWSDNILSLFTYLITKNSNFLVGLLTGIVGATQVIFTLFTALAADQVSRVYLLRIGGFISLIAIVTSSIAVLLGHYLFLLISMIIWGLYWAFTAPACDSLLADSVDAGNRSRVYSWSYTMRCVGGSVGPFVSVVMFATLGDTWKISECKIVMLVGLTLLLIPTALLFLFEDTNVSSPTSKDQDSELDSESHHGMLLDSSTHATRITLSSSSSDDDDDKTRANADADDIIEISLNESPNQSDSSSPSLDSSSEKSLPVKPFLCFPEIPEVPAMIALADVIFGLASGMTIKFFPIFFVDSLKMSPVQISLLYTVSLPLSL
jgi:MFS family permease